jgi:hypothetical protein
MERARITDLLLDDMALPTKNDDEELKKRYAPQLTGMPAALATIAAHNLGNQDASISSVNAVARMRSALPGVGEYGSTPETDQTNLNIASAMDRADLSHRFGSPQYQQPPTIVSTRTDEISQQRSVIEGQKKQIMAKLGVIPPSEAGYAAVVMPTYGSREHKNLLEQWNLLENQSQSLLKEHQDSAVFNAHAAHEELVRDTHIRAANGMRKLAVGLAEISKEHPKGQRFDDKVADWLLTNKDDPDVAEVIGTPGYERILKPHLESSKNTTDTVEKLIQAGHKVRMTHLGPQGPSYEIGDTEAAVAPAKVQSDHAKLVADKAVEARNLLLATQDYNTGDDKKGAKKRVDESSNKIEEIDARLGTIYDQFPILNPANRASRKAATTPQAATETQPTGNVARANVPSVGATDIIARGGHHYEVDHTNKKVLRQID